MQETYKGYTIQYDYDQSSDSPAEWGNYTITMRPSLHLVGEDNWTRYMDENDHLTIAAIAMLRSGRLHPIRYSEHGLCRYDIGSESDPDGFIEFSPAYIKNISKSDRLQYAKSDLETYTFWANGEVYGFTMTDPYGQEWDDNTSWGYYGSEDAQQAAHDGIESHLRYDSPTYHTVHAGDLHK